MVSLLIDFNNIINSKKHSFLLDKIEESPKTKFQLGLILIIPQKQLDILDDIKIGDDKVNYLNTPDFVDSIQESTFIIINKDISEIVYPKADFITLIIKTIENNFPNILKICVSIPIKNTEIIEKYAKNSFGNPYICKKSITKKEHKTKTICLVRDKNVNKNYTSDINYVLKQNKNVDYCMLSAKLSEKTIKYMKNLCNIGFTQNKDGKISQKEIAGGMYAKKIDDNLVHTIEIDNSSVIHGEEFGVDIVVGLYNFHSHPRNAYKEYNVKLGWPSAQDYIGFLIASLEDDTIFHMVATLEGIYIISLSKEWSIKKQELNKKVVKIIENNYNFCYKDGDTIEWYLNKINNVIYKQNPLFSVQYLSWKNSSNIFKLPYPKTGDNCFSCRKTKEIYGKFHS